MELLLSKVEKERKKCKSIFAPEAKVGISNLKVYQTKYIFSFCCNKKSIATIESLEKKKEVTLKKKNPQK